MSSNNPIESARSLRELVESEAENVERNNSMTSPVVDALVDAGLFRLLVPKDLGGMEADIDTIIDVCEELSFADGSVGWAFAQNTTVMAYSSYLAPEFAQPLADARAAAGMFAPLGVANKIDGGYQVSGNYQFGSGCGHAEYMGGGALAMENGEMIMQADGMPLIVAFIVPSDRVTFKGNWDVMGLKGTGSFDFEVPEQFVSNGQTLSAFNTETITGGPLYGLGSIVVGTISSTAWALGVARRALHEIAEIAKGGRERMGSLALKEQQIFQRDLGYHTVAVKAAMLMARNAYGSAVLAVADNASAEQRAESLRETKAAATYVTKVAKAAVTFAYDASGSHGLRNPSRLQRCYRDISVGAAHQVFDERNLNEYCKPALGLEPSPF
ncbi:MAG: acyl-CoA dehydrogenase family protein [Pseudomonadales bacterium]